jgi:hypothetical protein
LFERCIGEPHLFFQFAWMQAHDKDWFDRTYIYFHFTLYVLDLNGAKAPFPWLRSYVERWILHCPNFFKTKPNLWSQCQPALQEKTRQWQARLINLLRIRILVRTLLIRPQNANARVMVTMSKALAESRNVPTTTAPLYPWRVFCWKTFKARI